MTDEPQALIPYQTRLIGSETIPTVDGRDLHQFLQIARDYSDWIRRQIKRARLAVDRDYIHVVIHTGARPSLEYFFTFDAAKHIGMLSNTDKGHQVREYFLECERQMLQPPHPRTAGDLLVHMAEAYRDLERRTTQLEAASHAAHDHAIRAETKADMALADSRHQSLEDFVILNHLLHQFPITDWHQLGKRLQDYCALHNLHTYKVPVVGKPWREETVYPLQALAWLARYPRPQPQVLRFPRQAPGGGDVPCS